jgi:RNA polymerase sigma-70 factor, ECF subfamily
MERSDQELVVRYRGGDVEALEQLVERYRKPMFGFILNLVGDGPEADEVFQEAWVRVIHTIGRYREGNFGGWLFRIARNLTVDHHRRRRRLVSLDETSPEGRHPAVELQDPGRSPAEEAAGREVRDRIAQAVRDLPPEQKEVFLLRVEGALPFREIAGVQGVSINTALARMQYALAKLRAALGPRYRTLQGGVS